ncbi:hypothetical protein HH1059_03410 [Halorhodospira halochloris]|uniref:Uncharacterized protein n=1 Tax=Halorhodospira halochloris TaxID=1052 RepID=A0A2Z6EZ88_HALHR|nr:hypothetical protein HH1059_03410 [Halorhodospira halochloris]
MLLDGRKIDNKKEAAIIPPTLPIHAFLEPVIIRVHATNDNNSKYPNIVTIDDKENKEFWE